MTGINYTIIHKNTGKRLKTDSDLTQLVLIDGAIQPDHLWKLEESQKHPNYYYITNMVVNNAKVAIHSSYGVIYYEGARYNDQLWKFVQHGEKYEYRIVNLEFANHNLVPAADETLSTSDEEFRSDQLWQLLNEMDYPC